MENEITGTVRRFTIDGENQDFRYQMNFIEAVVEDGKYVFRMPNKFIPLQTLFYPASNSLGTINGQELGAKNLMGVFFTYEDIAMLVQSVQNLDMSVFEIPAGNFIPEPTNAVDASKRYVLYYLER